MLLERAGTLAWLGFGMYCFPCYTCVFWNGAFVKGPVMGIDLLCPVLLGTVPQAALIQEFL